MKGIENLWHCLQAVRLETSGRGVWLHEAYFGERRTLLMKDVLEHMLNVLLRTRGNGDVIMGCLMINDVTHANINLLA